MDYLNIIFRWTHVAAVIVMVGGVFFLRMVVHPVLMRLDEQQRGPLRAGILGRWKFVVHACVVLILGSGLYNYLGVTRPLHEGQPQYHMLIGIKILLAMLVFFIAEALVGRAKAFEPIRKATPVWLIVSLVLAAAIIAISSYVKFIPPASAA